MGSKSDYAELAALDAILGQGFTKPATVYAALFTVTPSDTGGGTEATGGAYARVAITNNATNWPNAAAGAKSNGTKITFPISTGSGYSAGAPIVAWGLFDDPTAGNLLYWGAVTPNVPIASAGITPEFAVGDLALTED